MLLNVRLCDGDHFVTSLRLGSEAGRSVVVALDGAVMWIAEPNTVVRFAGSQTLNSRFALLGAHHHAIMNDRQLALQLTLARLIFDWTPSDFPRPESDGWHKNETVEWDISLDGDRRQGRRRVCWNSQTRTVAAPQGSCAASPNPTCGQCINHKCAAGCGLDPGCTCTDTTLDHLAGHGFYCAILTNAAFRTKLNTFLPLHSVIL
jgi:hypothetical protein